MAETPMRFFLLDILRGFASLAVIIFHYQHFFYSAPAQISQSYDVSEMPFYSLVPLLYEHGGRAVVLFFALSGFIFFSQYLHHIEQRTVDAKAFFVLRFSRLYPLHLVTLIFVAALQILSQKIDGQNIVYPCNDPYNFFLQSLFISSWALSRCTLSFNGPIWSVSVEVFLYISFFIFSLLPFKKPGIRAALALAAVVFGAACMIFDPRHGSIITIWGEAIVAFYAGGLVWLLMQRLTRNRNGHRLAIVFGATIFIASCSALPMTGRYFELVLDAGVFPSAVLLLVALQYEWPHAGRRQKLVGDITYATYLLHFPVQLTVLLLIKAKLITINFSTYGAFIAFFVLVIALSILCYRYFERPAQSALRAMLLAPGQRHRGNMTDRGVSAP